MKGSRNPPPAAPSTAPLSPTAKGTAKYTNKDGSKFITVPKTSTPVESAQPSPTIPPPGSAPPVNRKKQKRRAKQAAKAAAEQALNNPLVNGNGLPSPTASHAAEPEPEPEPDPEDDEDGHYGGDDSQQHHPHQNGTTQPTSAKSKKAKKKKKRAGAGTGSDDHPRSSHDGDDLPLHSHKSSPRPIPPPPPPDHHGHNHRVSNERIWNTSSQVEREQIKEFWLGLSEADRKSLVKVEKDAVLKKMKEQQKQTCSCTVCGRKRTAIEEELEGLYDAYYEELEHYANHPNQGEGPPMLRARHSFGSMAAPRPRGLASSYSNHHQPSRGQIVEHADDEDEADEGDEDEDDYSDEDELDDDGYTGHGGHESGSHGYMNHRHSKNDPGDHVADFFNFGNSLTVQGGILTVADDLLKNDGKKFIEMMEQLAERRMQREEGSRYGREGVDPSQEPYDPPEGYADHTQQPPQDDEFDDEDDDYEEEDDDEFDSQEEEETMTEEQRMEEGRRMFQIFAARMFEQRVLTAYREKVARERQAKLIQELEDEDRQELERKAKKAKEAQKRKEKAARKKEALAEAQAQREAEKAAEEAARRAEEARKAEEQRAKAEEKRRKKEAQKKLEEEDRQRKEAERLRKVQEREENERKMREAKEREKKAREEARLREREAREQKEREAREKREQQEREKREKDRARAEREQEAKEARELQAGGVAKEGKEKRKKEDRAAQKAAALAAAAPVPIALAKRPAQPQQQQQQVQPPPQQPPAPAPMPALPQQTSTLYSSPQISVATPAFPKAPTPIRARQASQQESSTGSSGPGSRAGSVQSQNPSPHPLTPVHASPGPIGPPGKSKVAGAVAVSLQGGPPPLSHLDLPQHALNKAPLQQQQPGGGFTMPPLGGGMQFPPGLPHAPPGFGNQPHRDHPYPPLGGFRAAPGMVSMPPPGLSGPVGGRGFPLGPPPGFTSHMESPVPSVSQLVSAGTPKEGASSHSRQGSASYDTPSSQPGRPTPIGRPPSVVHSQRPPSRSPSDAVPKPEPDRHLGSSALLEDDFDEPPEYPSRLARGPMTPLMSAARPAPGFAMGNPFGLDHHPQPQHFMFPGPPNPWGPTGGGPQPSMFAPPQAPPPGFPSGPSPISGSLWGPSPMGTMSPFFPSGEPRNVMLRKKLIRACEDLASAKGNSDSHNSDSSSPFIPLQEVKAHLKQIIPYVHVDDKELLDTCETEGNENNGGGSFEVVSDGQDQVAIRFVSEAARPIPQPVHKAVGYPGEIGSPVAGGGSQAAGRGSR